jgi:hypothetical protein
MAAMHAQPGSFVERRLDLHTLIIALSSLWIGVDENDQACVERSGAQIRSLLAGLGAPGF